MRPPHLRPVPEPGLPPAASSPEAVLLTSSPALTAVIRGHAEAAGFTVEVVDSIEGLWRRWRSAPAVVVGDDWCERASGIGLPRRDHLVVAALGDVADTVFRHALALAAETVLPAAAVSDWLVDRFTGGMRSAASVVGVIGGAGGAGASIFAAALSQGAAVDGSVCLLDGDPHGPGLDLVLGMEAASGARWEGLTPSKGRFGLNALHGVLPSREGLAVLTWSGVGGGLPAATTVAQVVESAARLFDRVVVDLPRTSDGVDALTPLHRALDVLVVVVPNTLPGFTAARRLLARHPARDKAVAVVRGTRVDSGRVEQALGLPVIAVTASQRGLDDAVGLGLGPLVNRRCTLAHTVREVWSWVDGQDQRAETTRRVA